MVICCASHDQDAYPIRISMEWPQSEEIAVQFYSKTQFLFDQAINFNTNALYF